ncbi:hypothetical protein R3P38DRAFT_3214402 [Favolaschia claudopus]|uniref:Uncharacterized protein n=1 Tax=Favolaschia claudopus TaxID=2862362 RepID=A0AAW0AB19_9AGAR
MLTTSNRSNEGGEGSANSLRLGDAYGHHGSPPLVSLDDSPRVHSTHRHERISGTSRRPYTHHRPIPFYRERTSTPLRVYNARALTPDLQPLHIHCPLPLPLQSTDTFAPTHSSPFTAPTADIISALACACAPSPPSRSHQYNKDASTLAHLSMLFSSSLSRPTFTAEPLGRRQGVAASSSFPIIPILHLPPCPGPRVPRPPYSTTDLPSFSSPLKR